MEKGSQPTLPLEAEPSHCRQFSRTGYVVYDGDWRQVFVGGSLLSSFHVGNIAMRNVALVISSQDPDVRYGKLAAAFGVSTETLRLTRRAFEKDGIAGVVEYKKAGRPPACSPRDLKRLRKEFESGATAVAAHKAIKERVSASTVAKLFQRWRKQEEEETGEAPDVTSQGSSSESLELFPDANPTQATSAVEGGATAEPSSATPAAPTLDGEGAVDLVDEPRREVAPRGLQQGVQHAGTWLMIAMVASFGLHGLAEHFRQTAIRDRVLKGPLTSHSLRCALDAFIVALSLGQRCVEGVRRISTPTISTVLRRKNAISETWVRRLLHVFAEARGQFLHFTQTHVLLGQGKHAEGNRFICYVDNHPRTYTGKHKIRKVWRMQDKRSRPGISDYYVHDDEGCPLFRVDDPTHASLGSWLPRIGGLLREALGEDGPTPLLVFDRAGANPENMKNLRNLGLEFATYERAPLQMVAISEFVHALEFGDETFHYVEAPNKNLGKGRGRVRRIAVRTPEGKQVNILAVGDAPAPLLIQAMFRRWACQENQFKHAAERWGANHIDSYKVEDYDANAIIPNPARGKLEHKLKIARAVEGEALRKLSRLTVDQDDTRRIALNEDVQRARILQRELEELRAQIPTHAPVCQTPLAGELKRHSTNYKMLLDTIRIVAANAESELAARLAPGLPKSDQAKKTLANLFSATGDIHARKSNITVTLYPAGTKRELEAFSVMLRQVNQMNLALPGDPNARPLRFKIPNLSD